MKELGKRKKVEIKINQHKDNEHEQIVNQLLQIAGRNKDCFIKYQETQKRKIMLKVPQKFIKNVTLKFLRHENVRSIKVYT